MHENALGHRCCGCCVPLTEVGGLRKRHQLVEAQFLLALPLPPLLPLLALLPLLLPQLQLPGHAARRRLVLLPLCTPPFQQPIYDRLLRRVAGSGQ